MSSKLRARRSPSRSQSRRRARPGSSSRRETTDRRFVHETLEKRELLAAEVLGPTLVSVAANSGENFELFGSNRLETAPRELTFRFDGGQQIDPATLGAFTFLAAGGDNDFGNGGVPITPGFIGIGETENVVVARFAETLDDDLYQISIAADGDDALRNLDGETFEPNSIAVDGPVTSQSVVFDVEVGPRVVAVVPQPISGTGASRVQQTRVIDVYFNDDTLDAASAQDRSFYQLYFTNDTVETTDNGGVILPESAVYEAELQRVRLTFSDPLQDLGEASVDGSKTFRLRVGSAEALPAPPTETSTDLSADVADTFSGSLDTGESFGDSASAITISGEISATIGNTVRWPGIDSPFVYDDRRDSAIQGRADTNDGVNVFLYNFADVYGLDTFGNVLENAITPAQRQRAREVLDLYADELGVRFVETEDRGLQIVTGDLRALVETAATGQGLPFQEYRVNDADPSRGVLILDAAENWFDGYGLSPDARPSWFVEATRGIGNLLGIGDTFDTVAGVASGPTLGTPQAADTSAALGETPGEFQVEPHFLRTSDIIPGQALHRPEIRDADLYSFEVTQSGRVSIETFAQRLGETSLLDTDLKLWRLVGDDYQLVAANDDFYGLDSFIGIDVQPGQSGAAATYVLGVTANGNDDYNPDIADSGGGGRSQGRYEIRMAFVPDPAVAITDTDGSALDGNSDGLQGGTFNFWFRTAPENGTAARTIFVAKPRPGTTTPGANGSLATPYATIAAAFAAADPGDIIRVLPTGGTDGQIATTSDNVAYEIGFSSNGNTPLADGTSLEVPQGVTVMIDAGAIFKMRNAKISVGSETIDEDRSLAALQVLGAPLIADGDGSVIDGEVIFTSHNEQSRDGSALGIDTNPLNTSPAPADWSGIEFRNDFDYSEGRAVWENEGIFLDYVSHADLRYGGGNVTTNDPVVSPIELFESRPTLIYNSITNNADAGIAADPDSFLETTFNEPRFQAAASFTPDYTRVGPLIRGNFLVDNTINGLTVRIQTPAVGERTPMTVAGRFDDTDITHILDETLVLRGQPGGPSLIEFEPVVTNVLSAAVPAGVTGTLTPGDQVSYRITFFTADGFESLVSDEFGPFSVSSSGVVSLSGLPVAPEEFAGKRIYRSLAGGDFELATTISRFETTFVDSGVTRGGAIPAAAFGFQLAEQYDVTGDGIIDAADVETVRLLPRPAARLAIDPGMVIKLNGSRIETTFGSDFYAEGVDGNPIIFTSRLDDTYGAGGTFDTNDDGPGNGSPGQWGGLVFRQGSTASIDFATIRYAGGQAAAGGGFAAYNAVEILQSDVRIANSVLRDNASGSDGNGSNRDGVGFNESAVIFIRGAQPIIINNTIIDNDAAAISVNPDALTHESVLDIGRATGVIDRFPTDLDNQGPLVAGNQLDNNDVNAMVVRQEVVSTESVWDDTDIVHVVSENVVAVNHHYRGGLRLKSDPNQSLVVKFADLGQISADRFRTLNNDSVGGTLQILGQPGFPVILTSINDDSVGAGFTPGGVPQTDTLGRTVAIDPAAGDWLGLLINPGANDRNVAAISEAERAIATTTAVNATPGNAQQIGSLAEAEGRSDENRRLGFNIRGTLSTVSDIDVYSFSANGGTEVFLDIDDTDFGLDTIVEIIDVNGNIIAMSDNSLAESNDPSLVFHNGGSGDALPLRKSSAATIENPNPLDAGMRVVLPGNSATVGQYFVRVRSSNLTPDDASLTAAERSAKLRNNALLTRGRSSGQYQLSIRLGEVDEIAGTTIRLADIRYAVTAVTVPAAPSNSPLASESIEALDTSGLDTNDTNFTFDGTEGTASFTVNAGNPAASSADQLGNISLSERGVLRTSGVLGNNVLASDPNFTEFSEQDIDVFRVDLFHNENEPDLQSQNRFISTTFDIDYADQLGRANTSLAVYDALGRLILHGRDSNIADDQGRPRLGNDMADLSAGSAGTLDAYIGPVEMQEGTYYVVVSSAQMIPASLDQMFNRDSVDPDVRIYPVDSSRLVAYEDFEEIVLGPNLGTPQAQLAEQLELGQTADASTIRPIFDETSVVPYALEDVRLFLTLNNGIGGGTEQSTLVAVDPFTGQLERAIGEFGQPVGDLAMRPDGELFAYSLGPETGEINEGNTGNFLNISSIDGSQANSGDDGINFQRINDAGDGLEGDDNARLIINATAFFTGRGTNGANPTANNPAISDDNGDRVLLVGNRNNNGRELPADQITNVVYCASATSGTIFNFCSPDADDRDFGDSATLLPFGPGSNRFELGIIDTRTAFQTITGLAVDHSTGSPFFGTAFAVGDQGHLFSVDLGSGGPDQFYDTTDHGEVPVAPVHNLFTGTQFPSFSSVALGPQFTENGRVGQTLFGVTTDGWLYAFEAVGNGLRPAHVLQNGSYAVPILDVLGNDLPSIGYSPVGAAFSIRQENAFHITNDRALSEPNNHAPYIGHNQSRTGIENGGTLYFGFEPTADIADNTLSTGANVNGNLAPGGVHGTVVSRPFDLEGVARADRPTLYFNYFLETETDPDFNPPSDNNIDNKQVDAFRVFAAGDDGQWRLLTTNNSYRSFSNVPSSDEFDYGVLNGGAPVQETFENTPFTDEEADWRQARVDLSPLAGNKNVQLRFDFSTGGGMHSQFLTTGYLTEIQAPAGTDIANGTGFVLSDNAIDGFVTGGITTFEYVYDPDGLEPPPTNATATPIFYDETMSTVEVREAIRDALSRGLSSDLVGRVATPDNFPAYGTNRIRVFNQSLAANTSSTGFSEFLPGDEFGAAGSATIGSNQVNPRPGANNEVQGLYLDEIVIGFAERGETVYNAPANTDFSVLPENRTFTFDDTQAPEFPNEILVGEYTLEIRESSEYGVPEDYDPIRLGLNEQLALGRSFDTNDRMAGAVTLIAPEGRDLTDGDTFVIGNGVREVVFEFDRVDSSGASNGVAPGRVRVPFSAEIGSGDESPGDESSLVALAIRDAINSPQARDILGITAAGRDSREVGSLTGNRVELFGTAFDEVIQINPSAGRNIKVDLVAEETFAGRTTARLLPVVDHDDQTVTYDTFTDFFARAYVTDFVNGATDTLVATGKIGDQVSTERGNVLDVNSPYDDVDIVKVFLNAGDQIDIDLETEGFTQGTRFSYPLLELYREEADGQGTLIATSIDNLDPDADFTTLDESRRLPGESSDGEFIRTGGLITESGYYYIVVGFDQFSFDRDSEQLFEDRFLGENDLTPAEEAELELKTGQVNLLQSGFGEYQLTVRPSDLRSADVPIARDVLMVDYHFGPGDENVERQQGQFIIESNFISDSLAVGINATYLDFGIADDDLTFQGITPLDRRPGAAATLRNVNDDNLLPGTVIINNVVSESPTGIRFAGEVAAGTTAAIPVPFGRIVNNTVVGDGGGVGIQIGGGASPTVVNNIVSNFATGLEISPDSPDTVTGTNAFHRNGVNSNVAIASSSIVIDAGVEVFVDVDASIFIPIDGSAVIDSSFASLNDRSTYVDTVKRPVGIAPSPIIAPDFDAYGIPRVDDPDVQTPAGVGGNVFIDRGAVDRSDTAPPLATLVVPIDDRSAANVALGDDQNTLPSFVRLLEGGVEFFEIQLTDPAGTGPDVRTLVSENVRILENGIRLQAGRDYIFGFSDNSNVIRLTPVGGLWRNDAVYQITLSESEQLAYTPPVADAIADGDQVIITDADGLVTTLEYDLGFTVGVPDTITEGQTFTYSTGTESVTFEFVDGNPAAAPNVAIPFVAGQTAAEIAGSIATTVAAQTQLGLASATAVGANVVLGGAEGDVLSPQTSGLTILTQPGVNTGATAVPVSPGDSVEDVTDAVETALDASSFVAGVARTSVDTLLFDGVVSVEGLGPDGLVPIGFNVAPVRDLAGNVIENTRPNGRTQFTIVMPQVTFDLGDAPASYGTAAGDDGARHTITGDSLPRLGSFIDPDDPAVDLTVDDSDDQIFVVDAFGIAGQTDTVFDIVLIGDSQVDVSLVAMPVGGETLRINLGGTIRNFELVPGGRVPLPGNFGVSFTTTDTIADITATLVSVIDSAIPQFGQGGSIDLVDGATTFSLLAVDDEDGLAVGNFSGGGQSGSVFLVPGSTAPITPDDILGFLNPRDPQGTTLAVAIAGEGFLQGWVDFDGDGVFAPEEQVISDLSVSGADDGSDFVFPTIITPPTAITGDTWLRLRISTTAGIGPTGIAIDGEVEDYPVSIIDSPVPVVADDNYSIVEDTVLDTTGAGIPSTSDNDSPPATGSTFLPLRYILQPGSEVGGSVSDFDPDTGDFTFTPDPDFNGEATFSYRVSFSEDEFVLNNSVGQVATVTINVAPVNDPPSFDLASDPVVVEEDASGDDAIIADFVQNVLGGPPTATDEADQVVSFVIDPANPDNAGAVASGLFAGDNLPTIGVDGSLQFTLATDRVGTVTLFVTGTDDDPTDPLSTTESFTFTVTPVNDDPQYNTAVDGDNGSDGPDFAFEVSEIDGFPTLTLTLREDNTQPAGSTEPYFIPLTALGTGGYDPAGLLDLFVPGPADEISDVPGGSQTLELLAGGIPFEGGGPFGATDRGGVLMPATVDGREGLLYTPPTDFNEDIGGPDSFNFTVGDLGPDLAPEDQATAVGRVVLNLKPVNDRPVFELRTDNDGNTEIFVTERSTGQTAVYVEDGFASSIAAGPQATALDETNPTTGQLLDPFSFVAIGVPQNEAEAAFDDFLSIDTETGQLTFQASENVFGTFVFEVRLTDRNRDGSVADNTTRGDLISSLPQTITLTIGAVNDPPILRPDADPLVFDVNEDLIDPATGQAVDPLRIPIDGVGQSLLGVFLPGPAGEETDQPGGNQTVALGSPLPSVTAGGGRLTLVTDPVSGDRFFDYVPARNFVGTDTFIYTVVDDGTSIDADGNATADPQIAAGTVTINVAPVNDVPIFSGGGDVTSDEVLIADVDETPATEIPGWATNVLAGPVTAVDEINGTDTVEPQTLEFVFQVDPADVDKFIELPTATITDDGAATLSYKTAASFNGPIVVTYFLEDTIPGGDPDDSEQTTVRTFTINVAAVNDPPSFDIVDPDANGNISIQQNEDAGPTRRSAIDDIVVGPADEADQTVVFRLLPLDPSLVPLFSAEPTIDSAGQLRFTTAPNANTSGQPVVIQFVAEDSGGSVSDPIDVTLTINAVNDPPQASSDTFPMGGDDPITEDDVVTVTLAQLFANDNDPDLDPTLNPIVTDTRTFNPPPTTSANGALITFDQASGTITYDPTMSAAVQATGPGEVFTDSFTYTYTDSEGIESPPATVRFQLDGVNDAPVARPDAATLNPDGVTRIRVLDNDTDVDLSNDIDPGSIQITLDPAFGSLEIDPTGEVFYTPFVAFSGQDSFRYTVADTLGGVSNETTVTISTNIAPTAVADFAGTLINTAVVIDVAANDFDEGSAVGGSGNLDRGSIEIVSAPSRGDAFVTADGQVQYTPDPAFVGIDRFEYRIADNQGRFSEPATVTTQVLLSEFQNSANFPDVNNDGDVTPLDALLVIIDISERSETGDFDVSDETIGSPPFYTDVNGDNTISPSDALAVIIRLSEINNRFEGEWLASESIVSAMPMFVSEPMSMKELAVDRAFVVDPIETFEAPGDRSLRSAIASSKDVRDPIDLIAAATIDEDEDDDESGVDDFFAGLS